jgi:hypothetical protein
MGILVIQFSQRILEWDYLILLYLLEQRHISIQEYFQMMVNIQYPMAVLGIVLIGIRYKIIPLEMLMENA